MLDLPITDLLQRLGEVCEGLVHLLGPPRRPAASFLAVRRQYLRDALLGRRHDRAQREASGFERQAGTPGRVCRGNRQDLATLRQARGPYVGQHSGRPPPLKAIGVDEELQHCEMDHVVHTKEADAPTPLADHGGSHIPRVHVVLELFGGQSLPRPRFARL